jgi:hypothetical protein
MVSNLDFDAFAVFLQFLFSNNVHSALGWLTTQDLTMGLFLTIVAIFTVGFSLGYGVREVISQKRRAKAKRSRRVFDEGSLPTNNSYMENLSVKAEIAKRRNSAGRHSRSAPSKTNPAGTRPQKAGRGVS